MAYASWHTTVTDLQGNVIPNASIYVVNEVTGIAPQLYADRQGTVPLGNPFTAGEDGTVNLYVAGGAYRIRASFGAWERTWRYVGIGTAQEYDVDQIIGDLADQIEGAAEGYVQVVTWAELAAVEGTRYGQPGRVVNDGGTHTDPVVGGVVPNEGEYSWSESPPGWRRIGDYVHVGQFERSATESADWNAITVSGVYRTPLGSPATGAPTTNINMSVEHIESVEGRAWQRARQADAVAVRSWERFRGADGSWGDWVEVITSANGPEAPNVFGGQITHREGILSNSTDGVPVPLTTHWVTDFIPVNGLSAYSYTFDGVSKSVAFFDDSQDFISVTLATGTFNTPEGTAYVRVSNRYVDISPRDFALLEGRRSLHRSPLGNGAIRANNKGVARAENLPIGKSRNLFNADTHLPSHAIGATGNVTSNSGFAATDFIEALPNQTYSFSPAASNVRFAAYDENKTFISAIYTSGSFITPAGTSYIRGSIRYADTGPEDFMIVMGESLPTEYMSWAGGIIESPINKNVPEGYAGLDEHGRLNASVLPPAGNSPLAGKVIAGLGDSITYGFIPRNAPGYPGQLNSYLRLLGTKFGAATVRNYGISGSTLAYHATRNPMSRRFNAMNDDADLIILMGGTNDVRNGIALGNMGDTTDDTYYGALDVLARGLLNKYRYNQGTDVGKDKKIVFSTPIRLLDDTEADGLNALLPSFCQAIKDVGEKYSIPVFDAYNLSGLTPELFRTLQGTDPEYTDMYNPYVTDGTHPTQEGHAVLADALSGFVRGLF